jgi:methyl-accepting chemotaxis protein
VPRYLSIRFKLGLLVATVALVLSALDAWLIPSRVARAEADELHERARVLAQVLAGPLGVAMDLEQPEETLSETLRPGLKDQLVRWAALYDANGRKVTEIGETVGPDYRRELDAWAAAETIVGTSEMRVRNRTSSLGTVAVALKSKRIADRRAESQKAMALQACVIVALGLILALFVSGRMAKSMQRITAAARQITRGDVSGTLDLDLPNDELGEMARAFQAMNSKLRLLQESAVRVARGDLTGTIEGEGELFAAFRNMVENLSQLAARIGNSSSSVASAAAGMFSSVRRHEASAGQQNDALEQIRRSVETLTSSAEQVAADASIVREIAQRSLVSTQHTAEQTRLVSAHSSRIGEILGLIQDIADKSDLLALNAALEGTKAGEVGRGFSLVAAEMRRLSEHVMDSVRDIRRLVADMHEASHASVLATEEGTKLARETAAAATKISDAVERQREGTAQVRTAVVDIVGAVNDSLSGSGHTTRNAESLLELSHELKLAARKFRVGRVSHGNGAEPLEAGAFEAGAVNTGASESAHESPR